MSAGMIALVTAVGFAVAVVGVVTGGNSLVSVPVMIACGMGSREAIATNMFAVTFLALSGGVRFARSQPVRWDITLPLLPITLATSWLGARLLSSLSDAGGRILIAVSLVTMLAVMAARPGFGEAPVRAVSRGRIAVGYVVCAALGVYGGIYSAGYTTLLTFAVIGLLGASLVEGVGLTKIVNFASSAVASVEFARRGLIDYRVGLPVAVAMLVGAWVGAHVAVRRGHRFIRLLFLITVAGLALKVLWDVYVMVRARCQP